jgi:SAM-dependent methyltransferase
MTPKPAPLPGRPIQLKPQLAEYPGKELEAMAFASNYRRWIMEHLEPFLGRHVVEVGAGIGAFSGLILQTWPESLTVLEPSPDMHARLTALLLPAHKGVVEVKQSDLPGALGNGAGLRPFDTAVYINVLEHIEDDEAELETVFSALSPGGHILIFVPALPFLLSRMDREIGHFRRYTLKPLQAKCSAAGFTIKLAQYFDVFGVAPWWIKYRVLQSTTLKAREVKLHDQWIVPVSRAVEGICRPPFGKNIILVGQKPGN